MKRLAALAPDLDIFGSRYVLRDDAGWQLTEAGHAFLTAVETAPVTHNQEIPPPEVILAPVLICQSSVPPLRLVADNRWGSRRARARDRTNRSSRVA
jgi:hypothetical protein